MEYQLITVSEAARRLGKNHNRPLVLKMIKKLEIPTQTVGRATCFEESHFTRLAEALKAWDERLSLENFKVPVAVSA